VPDTRTKRQKLVDMAERGTPAEQDVARRKLSAMGPEAVRDLSRPPSQATMRTVFGFSDPFGEVKKVRVNGEDLTFSVPGPFDE
jgi:hypothetical protein